jgi:Domain of unknown function (DUF4340)
MNPIFRTLVFVGAAVLSLGAAGLTYWSHRPAQVDWAAELGEEFFPDFKDPNKATSLQVATFDKAASKTNSFSVEYKNGKWRIPSHNNYPADGKDRLKSTAASVIGITRGSSAGKTKDAHKEHNLLDPLDATITETEGRGDRITLKDGDKVLVDYIIGKRKDGSSNTYYIRRADEERFFLSEVKIELSTKFADWIEPDLLDLKQDDIQTILIDRYSVNEAEQKIVQGEQSILRRETATADWQIEGIDAATLKPKTSVISAMLKSFDDLKIVGVRRKPEGLSASLQGGEALKVTNSTIADLQSRGFYFTGKGLVSNEGDQLVSTFDGVSYVLRFGEVVTGSDIEIEAGSSKETEKKPAAEPKTDGDKPADPAQPEEADPAKQKNRFVFITAQFDEAALGPAPVEPKKPVAPKDDTPAKPVETKDGEKPAEPTAPVANPQAEAKAAYEAALKKYETDSDVYRIRKKEYDDKKTSGEKKAKALNTRFADWYYVISEELFTEIRVKPEDLVEPLVAAPEGVEQPFPETPPLPNVPKPVAPAEAAAPATEPAKPADGEKPTEPKVGDKPQEGDTPNEKPAADAAKPAEGDKPATETPKSVDPAPPTAE